MTTVPAAHAQYTPFTALSNLDGYAWAGAGATAWRFEIEQAFTDLPSELRDPVTQQLPPSVGRTGYRRPAVIALPTDQWIARGEYGSGFSGRYNGWGSIYLTGPDQLTFNHEWGHLVDELWPVLVQGHALGDRNVYSRWLTGRDSTLVSLYAQIQPLLPNGVYPKTNIREWFAEFFQAWTLNDTAKLLAVCATTPLRNQAVAWFTANLPYLGMPT